MDVCWSAMARQSTHGSEYHIRCVTYSRYRKVLCMKKIDTRRDAWDRDYMGNHYQKPKPRTVNMNITPVYVFAMFFIAILVMVGNK